MAGLKKRLLRVAFQLAPDPSSTNGQFSNPWVQTSSNVVMDETLNLSVRVTKDALALQNQAVIDVTNLTQTLRQQLLSEFSAYAKNQRLTNGVAQPYVDVFIAAGYEWMENGQTQNNLSQIYHGQVTDCDQVSGPPNSAVRIMCYTKQVNKTQWVDVAAPFSMTYREMVFWAGNQMGFDNNHIVCQTSMDDQIVQNPFASASTVASLLPRIQDQYYPNVAAFIDDDFLIVKDRNVILNPSDVTQLGSESTPFIGMPSWDAWGAQGTVFLDPSIRMGSGVALTSILNPTLGGVSVQGGPSVPGTYVVMGLEYTLASRATPFYVKVSGIRPATDQ